MEPKVSIITPLHNKGPYIAETIESVLSQSFPYWEMIVVENNSSDNGPAVVRSYEGKDKRVRLLVSDKQGPGVSRNLGMAEASGEWIQFLDADDLLLPGHLQTMFDKSRENAACDLLTCDWLEGASVAESHCQRKRPTNRPGRSHWKQSAVAFTPWVVHAAWVRQSALGEAPWWDESFDRLKAEDHVFWFRVLLRSREAAYSPHVGVFYRMEAAASGRHSKTDFAAHLQTLDRTMQANVKLLEASGEMLGYEHRRALLNSYLELGLLFARDPELARLVKLRTKQFRPPFLEAMKRKDLPTAASHVVPGPFLAWAQNRWREMARKRPDLAA